MDKFSVGIIIVSDKGSGKEQMLQAQLLKK